MGALRKLRLRFIWRRPVTWSLRHSVAGTQRRKQTALKHETYLTRKTQPGTNWPVFWQSITLLSSSSKTPGKATGSVSDWTHVRSLARRKSKWTIGGCGALRRCGSARTYEGTQFLCVKFRLGSAGKPTICSHRYDGLNEDYIFKITITSVRGQWIEIHVHAPEASSSVFPQLSVYLCLLGVSPAHSSDLLLPGGGLHTAQVVPYSFIHMDPWKENYRTVKLLAKEILQSMWGRGMGCLFWVIKVYPQQKLPPSYHRDNSPVTQTTPEPTLLSWGGWPCEKIFPHPWPHSKPGLIVLNGPLRPYCSQALWSCSGVSWK